MLSEEDFEKLNPDKISKALFNGITEIRETQDRLAEKFDNHLKHHEVLKKDFEDITKSGIISASIIAVIITLLGVTIGITVLIFNLRSLLGI